MTTSATSHEASEINAGVEIYSRGGYLVDNNNTNKSSDVALVKRQTRNSAEIETATDCSALRYSIFMDTCGIRSLWRLGRIFNHYVISHCNAAEKGVVQATRRRWCKRSTHTPEMEKPSCNWQKTTRTIARLNTYITRLKSDFLSVVSNIRGTVYICGIGRLRTFGAANVQSRV